VAWGDILRISTSWHLRWWLSRGDAARWSPSAFDSFLTIVDSPAVTIEPICTSDAAVRGALVTVVAEGCFSHRLQLTLAADPIGPFCMLTLHREHALVRRLGVDGQLFLEGFEPRAPVRLELAIKRNQAMAPARRKGLHMKRIAAMPRTPSTIKTN